MITLVLLILVCTSGKKIIMEHKVSSVSPFLLHFTFTSIVVTVFIVLLTEYSINWRAINYLIKVIPTQNGSVLLNSL